jgi:ABC-2 type transport system ATP-binding protein
VRELMIEKTVKCPNCKKLITVSGNPGETVKVNCPSCKSTGKVTFNTPSKSDESNHISPNYKIQANNITVKFGTITALNSFTVNIPKDVVGLLGPNGAGKSTFIKVVLGLLKPQSGKILLSDHIITDNLTELRDLIGYMPEHECLIESMTAIDMVSYMGQISGMMPKDAMRRSHEALDFVGIDEVRYRDISSYSSGMKQRVKLAQAIVHDPEILFLDEPTNGMDPFGKKEMLSLISDIAKTGKTIIVCSHLLHEVEQICNYVVIINQGRLLKTGSMNEILSSEKGRYKLELRGDKNQLEKILAILDKNYEIVSVNHLLGKLVINLKNIDNSLKLFNLIKKYNVQIRSYKPDKLILEDVFIQSFGGGKVDGN